MKLIIDIPEVVHQMAKKDMLFGAELVTHAIKNGTPTEPKAGRWIDKEVFDIKGCGVEQLQSCRCDQCEKYNTTPFIYYFKAPNYCPECGAKMKNGGRK